MKQTSKWANISWVWIVLSFIFQLVPVAMILLVLKIIGMDAVKKDGQKKSYRPYQGAAGPQTASWQRENPASRPAARTTGQTYRESAQDVEARPVDDTDPSEEVETVDTAWSGSNYHGGQKAGDGSQPRSTSQASERAAGGYRPVYRTPRYTGTRTSSTRGAAIPKKLNPNTGKGLQIAGWIILGAGCFVSVIVMLAGMAAAGGFMQALFASAISGTCICTPGAVMAVVGARLRARAARCRNHLAMIGTQRTVSLDALDAASPGSFRTVCRDLEWMMGSGFFPGAYLDLSRRVLTYPGAEPEQRPKQAPVTQATTDASGRRSYPEEQAIHTLNARIQDAYVSQRMERLEQLTHQIFAYVEANPEKETAIRQFKSHYLPKTIKILESYARLEQQRVDGENIRAAMKDVEQIMDKLVAGFEKQLDLLFSAEAMDVTTDISVLESMMNMEGLGNMDPFGSLRTGSFKNEL